MKTKSKILIAVSAVLMLSIYFLPLWRILLEAPQYPEGLEMKIWLTGLTGNIDQINGLNHYIGMKHIAVANFWEFKVLPYVYGLIVAFGFFVAWRGKLNLLWIWLAVLLIFAIFGLTDFYLWEYNYGHNLDPMAAIKVEGMTYQPPLIGYKQLLNFLAGSFPDIGGILVGIGGFIAATVLFTETRLKRKISIENKDHLTMKSTLFLSLFILFVASGCGTTEPQAIDYGKDVCTHCKMVVADPKYGAEMITKKGKIYKFDSAECLMDFVSEDTKNQSTDAQLLVINFAKPTTFIDAKNAFYLIDKGYQSPMGGNIVPFESEILADNNKLSPDAKIMTFEEVLKSRK
jgi:copper chaperone NosL